MPCGLLDGSVCLERGNECARLFIMFDTDILSAISGYSGYRAAADPNLAFIGYLFTS